MPTLDDVAKHVDSVINRLTKKSAIAIYYADAEFVEGDHPRAENGQFGSGGGGAAPSAKPKSMPTEIPYGLKGAAKTNVSKLLEVANSDVSNEEKLASVLALKAKVKEENIGSVRDTYDKVLDALGSHENTYSAAFDKPAKPTASAAPVTQPAPKTMDQYAAEWEEKSRLAKEARLPQLEGTASAKGSEEARAKFKDTWHDPIELDKIGKGLDASIAPSADRANWSDEQANAVHQYSIGSNWINEHLRGVTKRNAQKKQIEGQIKALQEVFASPLAKLDRDVVTDRFMRIGDQQLRDMVETLQTGSPVDFQSPGFVSTTSGGNMAKFSSAANVHMEIMLPKGTPAIYMTPVSNYPGENEVLLNAGSKFKIISAERKDGKIHFKVTYDG